MSSIFPIVTKAAWNLKRGEILKAEPSATRRKFVYNLSRSSYRKRWGKGYKRPGAGTRAISFLFRVLPKIGPLRAFGFKAPTSVAETLFMQSVNETLTEYRKLLADQSQGALKIANRNFDTGESVQPGTYRLVDATYAKLLDKLSGKRPAADLRADILAFYSDLSSPFATKQDERAWKKVLGELEKLKANGQAVARAP